MGLDWSQLGGHWSDFALPGLFEKLNTYTLRQTSILKTFCHKISLSTLLFRLKFHCFHENIGYFRSNAAVEAITGQIVDVYLFPRVFRNVVALDMLQK